MSTVSPPQPIRLEAGLSTLAQLGYHAPTTRTSIEHALGLWGSGQQDEATAHACGTGGLGLDDWFAVLSSAVIGGGS